jgi:hypothetical protein
MSQTISEDLLWSQIVAKAWCDQDLMTRLLSDPRNVLVEHGMDVPDGTEVKVVEDPHVTVVKQTDSVFHFTLPLSPPEELIDEDLVGGAVAQCFSGWCGACGMCGRCGCRCRCGRCW